ncbi:MAG: LamG domain-containing protein [Pyrinomonadaceae bacterium]|nr:LamG domain-containing protein [Pyrinomonadaceae bacterium]
MNLTVNTRVSRRAILFVFTVFCFLSASFTETSAQTEQEVSDHSQFLAPLSLSLSEDNAYLSVAHNTNLSPPNALTVEAWVKPFGVDNSQIVVDRLNQDMNAGRGGFQLRIQNGSVVFMICPDNLRSRCVAVYGRAAIQPNSWQHIAATFQNGEVRVYLNGRLEGRRSKFVRSTGNAVGTLTIGAGNGGNSRFRGLLDEIRISNQAVYQANFAPLAQLEATTSTVGLWRFDSGSISDSSSHNHPTTMLGNASFSSDVPSVPTFGFRYTPTPNVGPSNSLVDVVAISPSNVWAVGSHGPADRCCFPKAPVALRWNGTSWTNVPVPTVPGFNSFILKSVDGNSSSDVWAIGEAFNSNGFSQKFLLRYDGNAWTFAAAISPNADFDIIRSISVINNNDIWIVGYRSAGASLTLHWDGTNIMTVPSPGGRLIDVDAISSNEVWAVGDFMAIRWNGSVWQVIPGEPTNFTYLRSVAAIAPNNIFAVGRITTCGPFSGCSSGDLMLRYNGTSWAQVPIENFNPQLTTLEAVSASGPDSVWVVGNQSGSLVLRFDGAIFRRVATERSPNTGADIVYDSLLSVSVLNPNEVWTVGNTSSVFYSPSREVVTNLALRGSLVP